MLTKLEKRFLRACRDLGGSGVPSSDLQELAQASSEYELYLCACTDRRICSNDCHY